MIKESRRVVFNLHEFIEDLEDCIRTEHRQIEIHDVVQDYKGFISRQSPDMMIKVKSYVDKHPIVVQDKRVKSFITACYK